MFFIKKIDQYIGKEILSITLIICLSLTSILFLFRILQYSEYIFVSGDGLLSILLFIVFLLPNIFKISIPLALFAGSAMTIARMSQDRELEAWMSCGASVMRISAMPAILGVGASLFSLLCSMYLEPIARQEWLKYKWMFARRNVEQMIENRLFPHTFISEPFRTRDTDVCLYVDWLSKSRQQFKGVFIATQTKDGRFASVISADSGSLRKEMRDGVFDYIFTVENGLIYEPMETNINIATLAKKYPQAIKIPPSHEGLDKYLMNTPALDWRIIRFQKFEISLVNLLRSQFAVPELDKSDYRTWLPATYINNIKNIRKQPNWRKLRSLLHDYTYFYEQIVIPLSCLFLPVIGAVLGMHDPRRKSISLYFSIGLVFFSLYATILLAKEIPLKTNIPPEIMLVLPMALLIFLVSFLLKIRMHFPPSVSFFEAIKITLHQFFSKSAK